MRKTHGQEIIVTTQRSEAGQDEPVYGEVGILAYDSVEDRIQCHACGRWLQKIESKHLSGHGLTISEYKEAFGLNETTPLETPSITERRRVANQKHEGWRNLRQDFRFQKGRVDVRRGPVRLQFRREHFGSDEQRRKALAYSDSEMLSYLQSIQREKGGRQRRCSAIQGNCQA